MARVIRFPINTERRGRVAFSLVEVAGEYWLFKFDQVRPKGGWPPADSCVVAMRFGADLKAAKKALDRIHLISPDHSEPDPAGLWRSMAGEMCPLIEDGRIVQGQRLTDYEEAILSGDFLSALAGRQR